MRQRIKQIFVLCLFLYVNSLLAEECTPVHPQAYSGPLFDAMAQTDQYAMDEDTITSAKSVGVTRMALFARVHKQQDGRSLVSQLAESHPEFIIQGAPKYFDMRDDLDRSFVKMVIDGVVAKKYHFVGEVLYTHGDKNTGEQTITGERYIDPTQRETEHLINGLKGLNIPIMTHWEVYRWARDSEKFHRLYSANNQQVFIWPHLGFGTPEQVDAILSAHSNVWATVSKKEKSQENLSDAKAELIGDSVTDECGNLLPEWKDIFVKYSGRLMFATDAHKQNRWSKYKKVIKTWRKILGQLPPDVASAIAFQNAERLYGSGEK